MTSIQSIKLDETMNIILKDLKKTAKDFKYLLNNQNSIDEINGLLISISEVFNKSECEELINISESMNYEKPLMFPRNLDKSLKNVQRISDKNMKKGNNNYENTIRDCQRIMIDSVPFSKVLEKKLEHFIPKTINENKRIYNFEYINPRFRFLKYQDSGHFIRHKDENYITKKNEKSFITILIYLNYDYEGAYTRFFSDPYDKVGLSLTPETGMVCLMQQDIEHEVPMIQSGIKYVIRTELMYS